MDMGITIRGHSDDIVYVEGDITEEFYPRMRDDKPAYLACSDGTLLRITYGADGSGCWRIVPVRYGTSYYAKREATDEDEDYSDVVTLMGSIAWVAMADQYAVPAGGAA
jgi:hypothetical protein